MRGGPCQELHENMMFSVYMYTRTGVTNLAPRPFAKKKQRLPKLESESESSESDNSEPESDNVKSESDDSEPEPESESESEFDFNPVFMNLGI